MCHTLIGAVILDLQETGQEIQKTSQTILEERDTALGVQIGALSG